MAILSIRKHQRFAVRRKASLCADKGKRRDGLLVELSLEGCRIGIPKAEEFNEGQLVKVRIPGFDDLIGQVRWVGDGLAGLRFVNPLHSFELDNLVQLCRGEGEYEMRAYGT